MQFRDSLCSTKTIQKEFVADLYCLQGNAERILYNIQFAAHFYFVVVSGLSQTGQRFVASDWGSGL